MNRLCLSHFLCAVSALSACSVARAQITEPVEVTGAYTNFYIGTEAGAAVERFGLTATANNMAGGDGLVQEGFGVPNFYVPHRRLNEKLDIPNAVTNRPVIQYSYDCEGPNIAGLRVIRTMEPLPDESSLRVRWRIEHRGTEPHWVVPWVQNDLTPGGSFDPSDQLRMPTPDGVQTLPGPGTYLPARNWIAATDATTKETLYGVFDADDTYAIAALIDGRGRHYTSRTVFVPRLMKPGEMFETVYRLNLVRGLDHVDFATDLFAAQIDYTAGELVVMLAPVRALDGLEMDATLVDSAGNTFKLPARRFDFAPGRLVRCTFPWDAPGEGTYEFLGQIRRNNEIVELGSECNPPHGGIDTHFTIGAQPPTPLEPWTDAPFRLQRRPRQLDRAMVRTEPIAIWIDSALEKIFPEDQPAPNGITESVVRLELARNEFEAFQIVVRPNAGQSVSGISLRTADLIGEAGGARIAADNIRAHRVGYIPAPIPSHFEGPTGDYPDPLPLLTPFTAEGGRAAPIWVSVYAPPDTPAGLYRGPVYVVSNDLDEIPMTLEVRVHDFSLPTRPALKTDFGFSRELALATGKAQGFAGTQGELESQYLRNALAHRVTLRELTQLPPESPDYASAIRAYEQRLGPMLDGAISTVAVPSSLQDFPDQLRLANEFIDRKNLGDRAFCPLAHEPPRPAWPRLAEYLSGWRRLAPSVRPYVTTFGLDPFLDDPDRIWGIHLPVFDTGYNQQIFQHITQGGEAWWYVDESPSRPYGNFFVDFAAIEHRILFWQTWALGIRGFHYWNINSSEPGANPYDGLLDATPVNGNGFLVYPGPNGPVDSIRWESIRDGIEDYDYLVIFRERLSALERRGGNPDLVRRATEALNLRTLVGDLVSFPREPQPLLDKRGEIARLIVELGPAN